MYGLNLDKRLVIDRSMIKEPNLCDRLTADDRKKIGQLVWEGYERDEASRSVWKRRMKAAMDLAMQVQEAKTFPWPGASNVIFPLVTIAALQFSGRSYTNIIQGTDVVRYRIIGDDPDGKVSERADRIGAHMSWQCLEQDQAWEEQHDRLFINLSIIGAAVMKDYFDGSLSYNVSEFVMIKDLVFDYWAKSVESAARKTQIITMFRNDLYEQMMEGVFVDYRNEGWFNTEPVVNPTPAEDKRDGKNPPPADQDTPYGGLEQHRFLDLDGDGYAEPYIATIERGSHDLLRLKARFEDEGIRRTVGKEIISIHPTEYFTQYTFIPSPDGGSLGMGFGIFLGPINEAVNSGINQLLDKGTMQNSIGGFLGRGAKMRGGNITFAPWQWVRVDSTGDDLKKNMVPFEKVDSDPVMMQLIGLLIEYANRIAGTTDEQVGKNPGQNTPAQTYQGMQEQGMQVYGMIFKRIWRSMKESFKKRYLLNRQFLQDDQRFGSGDQKIGREDYLASPDQIAPVADPNVTSNTLRMLQANTILEVAHTTPGFSVPYVVKKWLRAMKVEASEVDRMYPGPDKVPPLPNPKLAVENAKLEGKKMDIQADLQKYLAELREQRPLIQAQVQKLQAEAQKLVKEAGVVGVAERLEALQMAIEAMKSHTELIEKQIELGEKRSEALDGKKGDQPDGGGLPQLEGPPGNAGGAGAGQAPAGRSNGAMV